MWHSSLESPLVKPYYYVAVQGLSTLLPSIFKSIRNLGKYHLSEIFVQSNWYGKKEAATHTSNHFYGGSDNRRRSRRTDNSPLVFLFTNKINIFVLIGNPYTFSKK